MTLWSRFYRLIGGMGPELDWDGLGPVRRRLHRWRVPDRVALALCRCGFIKRDPVSLSGWWADYLWQWRFWRGPYRDALEAWQRDRDRRDFRRGAEREAKRLASRYTPQRPL